MLNPFGLPKNKITALTGGIASGKSTALKEFKRLGARVIDCDALARRVSRKGGPALQKISKRFGACVLKKDGSLNRKRLGSLIFADKKKRKVLENIIHPLIIEEIRKKTVNISGARPLILDVPLLFEAGLVRFAGKVIVVWAPESARVSRLTKRENLSLSEIQNRISSQMPLEEKKNRADFVIDNSGSRAAAKKDVKYIWKVLTKKSI